MAQKWNLQDIRPTEPRAKKIPTEPLITKPRPIEVPKEDVEDLEPVVIHNGNKKKNRSLIISIAVFFAVVAAGVGVSYATGGAEVTVNPKFREPNVNAVFEAVATPVASTDLAYEIMTLEAEGERQVTATGQEQVTAQAEGTIMIYNNHSPDPVRLVTNTRFQSTDGLIYKIKDSAVVPGYTTGDNGEKNPGVITAEVYADQPGEQYNLGPSRFTVPGFAGEPEFDNIYAQSVTAFTGGYDGLKFIIDPSELETAQQALRVELRNTLLDRIAAEIPAGFVQFPGAVTFTYESLPMVEYGENLATIKEKVYMRVPLFAESEFARYLAQSTVPGYEGEAVRIEDTSILSFEYDSATTSASNIAESSSLKFRLEGRPLIVWEYDAEQLKADLAGRNRTALNTVLGDNPSIERASATIRPAWLSDFPDSPEDITIVEELSRPN